MTDWSSAVMVAVAGFLAVFAVLTLLMAAMSGVGIILAKLAPKKAEEKR